MEVFKLYIIDKTAGICVFDQTFIEIQGKMAADLVTGFLHAMQLFAEEMAGQSIENITLSRMVITYRVKGKLLYALATGKDLGTTDERVIQSFLERVSSRFELKYQDLLDSGKLNNTSVFEGFARDVEDELGTKSTDVTYIETRGDKFKHHYETAVEDLRRLKKDLLHEYTSLTIPIARVIKSGIDGTRTKADNIFKFTKALLGNRSGLGHQDDERKPSS